MKYNRETKFTDVEFLFVFLAFFTKKIPSEKVAIVEEEIESINIDEI